MKCSPYKSVIPAQAGIQLLVRFVLDARLREHDGVVEMQLASPTSALQIYACGDHHHTVDETLPDLKAVTQQATGKPYRRIGRSFNLLLIGAARCTQAQAQALPSDTIADNCLESSISPMPTPTVGHYA